MPRDLILGTAGHIDHGKTSLVKALTGIDCDRLPEEKARGITIDIGFATLDLGDFRLGIVDVPGHERFIKNMLAGATGIDLALLVVAADDSVMPQTREHLEILKLLGLRHGVIALTKCDLVDETTREVVELEIRELVQGHASSQTRRSSRTSAATGLGIDELKAAIAESCREGRRDAKRPSWFRLPIDRSFIVQGHGTVVTGSVDVRQSCRSATKSTGQGDGTARRSASASLQNHDQPVEEVHRGQRAAINLAGVPHEDVVRGQELATPGYLVAVAVADGAAALPRPSHAGRSSTALPVRLHVGTAEIMATVSLLDCDHVDPGKWGLAQLFLEEPATTVWGQPFVLRGSSAAHTLGGGQVLQPVARKIRRRHLEIARTRRATLVGRRRNAPADGRLVRGFTGFTPADLVRGAGVAPDAVEPLVAQAPRGRKARRVRARRRTASSSCTPNASRNSTNASSTSLGALHAEIPLMTTHDRQKALARLDYVGDDALVQAVTDRLIAAKKLVGDPRRIARADFKPKLSANQRKLKDKIVAAHASAGFQPPEPKEFANQAGGNAAALQDLFEVASPKGFLVQVTDDVYLSRGGRGGDADAASTERLRTGPGATVAEIRDLLGTTRKFAVPICEYLDRIGVTPREGDLRVLAEPA